MLPFGGASQKCHAHLHMLRIMCRKFHSDDLKTVGGVWETTLHQQTDCLPTSKYPGLPAATNKKVGGFLTEKKDIVGIVFG